MAPVAVVIVATGTVVLDIFKIGQIVVGKSILVGNYELTLSNLPQFAQAELAVGGGGAVAMASVLLRVLCVLPLAFDIVLAVFWGLILNQITLHLGNPLERGLDMSRRWRMLALGLVSGGVGIGLLNTVIYWVLSLEISRPDTRLALLGAQYSYVRLEGPAWPFITILLGIVAATLALRLEVGVDPEARAPVDIADTKRAEVINLRSENRKNQAS